MKIRIGRLSQPIGWNQWLTDSDKEFHSDNNPSGSTTCASHGKSNSEFSEKTLTFGSGTEGKKSAD